MPDGPKPTLGAALRGAFRGHGNSVAIATTIAGGQKVGVLVSSLVSVSVAPPVVSISLSDASFAAQEVLAGDRMTIHLLTGGDRALADWFAKPRPAGEEPPWIPGDEGEARLATKGPVLSGVVTDRVRAGSATVVFVGVERVDGPAEEDPLALIHVDRHWHLISRRVAE